MKMIRRMILAFAAVCMLSGSLNSAVTVHAAGENTFSDVAVTSPYYEAISWAVDHGITTGKKEGVFAPDEGCTRAQFVTFLWRMQGNPEPGYTAPFQDMVSPSSPFYKAISWAVEKGITSGYADNTFRPNETCSRGAAVTFLYRAAGSPAVGESTAFEDMVPAGHAYYNGIVWAVGNSITTGYKDGTFKPFRTCSRGQNVTFLYRARSFLTGSEPVSPVTYTYVLNTNSRKFHYSYCPSAGKISAKNREEFTGTRDQLIAQGYEPCKVCKP